MRQLPKLSHIQFVILSELLSGPRLGREIRERLVEFGVRQGGPAFYQLMARMEDAGFVTGTYDQEIVESQIIRQRSYRVSIRGRTAWENARSFYARAAGLGQPVKGSANG